MKSIRILGLSSAALLILAVPSFAGHHSRGASTTVAGPRRGVVYGQATSGYTYSAPAQQAPMTTAPHAVSYQVAPTYVMQHQPRYDSSGYAGYAAPQAVQYQVPAAYGYQARPYGPAANMVAQPFNGGYRQVFRGR